MSGANDTQAWSACISSNFWSLTKCHLLQEAFLRRGGRRGRGACVPMFPPGLGWDFVGI